jgi:hypothetical protein
MPYEVHMEKTRRVTHHDTGGYHFEGNGNVEVFVFDDEDHAKQTARELEAAGTYMLIKFAEVPFGAVRRQYRMDGIVDAREIADILGFSTPEAAANFCRSGKLPSARKKGNAWIADRAEVMLYKTIQRLEGRKGRSPKGTISKDSGTLV